MSNIKLIKDFNMKDYIMITKKLNELVYIFDFVNENRLNGF
ncbi:MAG: hypothetical protein ACRDA5_02740 [Clostridium sp.]